MAAAASLTSARRVQEMFDDGPVPGLFELRPLAGSSWPGQLKNVIRIAAGICAGLGFGDNAVSALMTPGIVEITRFGRGGHAGRTPPPFARLAGIGDLITATINPHGRNRGDIAERIGQGEPLDAILSLDALSRRGLIPRPVLHDLARLLEGDRRCPISTGRVYHHPVTPRRSPLDPAERSSMMRPPREE